MRLWMQRSALATAIVLALAACSADSTSQGADSTTSTVVAESSTTTESPPTTEGSSGGQDTTTSTAGESSTTSPPPQVEGPVAPDFTFALSDGSSFSLSDEQKPVYLVFWAEW